MEVEKDRIERLLLEAKLANRRLSYRDALGALQGVDIDLFNNDIARRGSSKERHKEAIQEGAHAERSSGTEHPRPEPLPQHKRCLGN